MMEESLYKIKELAGYTPVIPSTQEVEVGGGQAKTTQQDPVLK